jgi:hypothetical protein
MWIHPTGRGLARLSRPARIMCIGVAATLAAGSTTALAFPTTTWTVKPGGAISIVTGKFTLTDPKTNSTITCTSTKLSGTVRSGSGLPGTHVGTIPKVSFTKCLWAGVNPDLAAESRPWHLNLTSYSNGLVTGTVSHMVIVTANGGCVTIIESKDSERGSVRFTYNDSTNAGKFTGGNLHVVNEICAAQLFHTGDPIHLAASFRMQPAQSITSP